MNDDELRKLWQEQPLSEPALSAEQLISAMESKMTGFRRILLLRDIRELAACAVVIVIFGFLYYFETRWPISRVGDLIVIGSAVFIAWKLLHARRSNPPAPPGATVVESLRAELNSVRAQSNLLSSIAWWYLLPLGIGIFVCTWGRFTPGTGGLVFNIVYSLGVIALCVFLYRLNQRARAKQLLPLEAQLQLLLHSSESGEPLDETQAVNLRPIAISMTAAGQVKPAEFKVAFWQLAIWAEVGFIGIWLFLMLGLAAEKSKSLGARERASGAAGHAVHFEINNRYSVAAQKIMDFLNAGDYAAVQKLYDSGMAEAFPPTETAVFYTDLTAGFGRIESIEGPIGKGYRDWTAFRLHCENGDLIMSLALDDDGKISGIYFKPDPSVNLGAFVHRFFAWQHLAWLPVFFLGGLLCAWLLQKQTERTVGISSLGIHLHQGLNLMLWDEIKEVRPLRILNMQYLRLINHSGEKTLIPWTSLEQHCDLKSAIENSAPPNHPIRKYLALLKRI